MRRFLWAFGAALAGVSMPLTLSAATTWLLVPAHLVLTVTACTGALAEAVSGHPARARLWGFMHLVATALTLGGLQAAETLRGEPDWAWAFPFTVMLVWGWIPPVLAGSAAWWAAGRRRVRPARHDA